MQAVITEMLGKYGYLGVVILIFAENIFPPIPSEVILTFGGFLTTCTELGVLGTTIAATIGSVLGAVVLYGVGKLFTPDRLCGVINGRIGRILRLKAEDIERARSNFIEKGNNTVFFCRFIPIVRSMISIPAGMAEMNFAKFLILTTLGSFSWNIVLISIGAFAGSSWEKVSEFAGGYSEVVKIALAMLLGIIVIKNATQRMALKKAGKGT